MLNHELIALIRLNRSHRKEIDRRARLLLPLLSPRNGEQRHLLLIRVAKWEIMFVDTTRKSLRCLRVSSEFPGDEIITFEIMEIEQLIQRYVRNLLPDRYVDKIAQAAARERSAQMRAKEARWRQR